MMQRRRIADGGAVSEHSISVCSRVAEEYRQMLGQLVGHAGSYVGHGYLTFHFGLQHVALDSISAKAAVNALGQHVQVANVAKRTVDRHANVVNVHVSIHALEVSACYVGVEFKAQIVNVR